MLPHHPLPPLPAETTKAVLTRSGAEPAALETTEFQCSFSERLCSPGVRTRRHPSPMARGKSQRGRLGSEVHAQKTRVTLKLPGSAGRRRRWAPTVSQPPTASTEDAHTRPGPARHLHPWQQDAHRAERSSSLRPPDVCLPGDPDV